MSDKDKDATPPPLLLMGASGGTSWNNPQGASLFMPVPQAGSAMLTPEEGGEEDSFVGQNNVPAAPMNFFAPPATSASPSDPFANIGHNPHPTSTGPSTSSPAKLPPTAVVAPTAQQSASVVPPPSALPTFSAVPQVGGFSAEGGSTQRPSALPPVLPTNTSGTTSANMFRHTGGMKYAPPPPGTYATNNPITHQQPHVNPASSFLPPPFSDGAKSHPPPPPSRVSDVNIPSSYVTQSSNPQPVGEQVMYTPVEYHWFYSVNIELRQQWLPFSFRDSNILEQATLAGADANTVIATDGGRFDVRVTPRTRHAVYWEEPETRVRRCSWFYKLDGETKFTPYEEDIAVQLEDVYRTTLQTGEWHKRHEFPAGDSIVVHNAQVIVHFSANAQPDEWGTTSSDQMRPRVVRRGTSDINVEIAQGESPRVDQVVFVVHGIGLTCDLRFRSIVECVNDMRSYSQQMSDSHYKRYQMEGRVGRVEYLPVRWHAALHGDATGVDRQLKAITLGSIGKLRQFTNDTLLDILFYASPVYAQQIANTVALELNRLHSLFLQRNPGFGGQFSVCGHSLGSLILFDLLLHQDDPEGSADVPADQSTCAPISADALNGASEKASTGNSTPVADTSLNGASAEEEEETLSIQALLAKLNLQEYAPVFEKEQVDVETLTMCEDQDLKDMGIPLGPRKKLQGYVKLQKHRQKKDEEAEKQKQLEERLAAEAARQQQQLSSAASTPSQASLDHTLFRQPSSTCVSYVQGAAGIGIPFVQYKRLDFEPAHFFALGSPIAMFLTVRGVETLGDEFKFPTCPAFFNIFHPFDVCAYRLEPLIVSAFPPKPVLMPHHKGRKRLHLEFKESLTRMGTDLKQRIVESVRSTWQTLNSFAKAHRSDELMEADVDSALQQIADEEDRADTESLASSMQEDDILVGNINQGRRIDYVLQEAPYESFNEYLFAIGSHLCYWESEDTVLLMLKEIYDLYGIHPIKPGSEPPTAMPVGSPPRGPLPTRGSPDRRPGAQGTRYPSTTAPPPPPSSQYSTPQGHLPPWSAVSSSSSGGNFSTYRNQTPSPVPSAPLGHERMHSAPSIVPAGLPSNMPNIPASTSDYTVGGGYPGRDNSAPPPLTGFVPKK